MHDVARVAPLAQSPHHPVDDSRAPIHLAQKKRTGVRGHRAAVEVRLHRLALQVGEAQVHLAILFHGRSPCLVVVEALIPLSCIFTTISTRGLPTFFPLCVNNLG